MFAAGVEENTHPVFAMGALNLRKTRGNQKPEIFWKMLHRETPAALGIHFLVDYLGI